MDLKHDIVFFTILCKFRCLIYHAVIKFKLYEAKGKIEYKQSIVVLALYCFKQTFLVVVALQTFTIPMFK